MYLDGLEWPKKAPKSSVGGIIRAVHFVNKLTQPCFETYYFSIFSSIEKKNCESLPDLN